LDSIGCIGQYNWEYIWRISFYSPNKKYIGASNGLLMQGSNLDMLISAPALAAVVSLFGGWQSAPFIFLQLDRLGLFPHLR
jgi:hypothetical protein